MNQLEKPVACCKIIYRMPRVQFVLILFATRYWTKWILKPYLIRSWRNRLLALPKCKALIVEGGRWIIINVLVSPFWFAWIPMICVCGHYKYFNSYSAGIDFRRQNLTSTDVRFWRLGGRSHHCKGWVGEENPPLYPYWSLPTWGTIVRQPTHNHQDNHNTVMSWIYAKLQTWIWTSL